ncbi:MAG: hypothetical protein PHQ36_06595 [Anaerolineales bacterium]|nr:hypothetical protein [Anaerolineales bacterium]
MNFSPDQFVFILALWGAALSTILGFLEFRKERRKITIFLVENNEKFYSITITNVGHRTITLMNLNMVIPSKGIISLNSLLRIKDGEDEVKSPLPVTLTDGEKVTIPISLEYSEYIRREEKVISITVNDAESIKHIKYKRLSYDAKSGSLLSKKVNRLL